MVCRGALGTQFTLHKWHHIEYSDWSTSCGILYIRSRVCLYSVYRDVARSASTAVCCRLTVRCDLVDNVDDKGRTQSSRNGCCTAGSLQKLVSQSTAARAMMTSGTSPSRLSYPSVLHRLRHSATRMTSRGEETRPIGRAPTR